jgi:hypothetical protein
MAGALPTADHPFTGIMNAARNVVFSRTLRTAEWANTTIAAGDTTDEIDKLRRGGDGHIVVWGGVSFWRSLMQLDLIDAAERTCSVRRLQLSHSGVMEARADVARALNAVLLLVPQAAVVGENLCMHYPDAEDMAKVQQALADLRVDERNPPSLAGLIRAWNELVAQVEAGYDWSIDEYWNDLTCREQLARIEQAAPAVADWLNQELQDPDERFRAATRESGRPQPEAKWFMNRIPRHPGPELARDVDGLAL